MASAGSLSVGGAGDAASPPPSWRGAPHPSHLPAAALAPRAGMDGGRSHTPAASPQPAGRAAEVTESTEHSADVACHLDCFASVLPPEGEPKVWTASPSGAVIIRNASTCEVISKIDNVQPTALCTTGTGQVWVGRHSGKISVYDHNGQLCTVVQETACATAPISLLCSHGDRVWSVAHSKDIVEWDSVRYSVVRVLFSQQPGDLVQALCPGRCNAHFALFAGTRQRIKVWGADGREGCAEHGGSRSLVFVPSHSQLWSASDGGIVVYSTRQEVLALDRVLSRGRPVRQLLHIVSGNRVWAFDDEQLTVYTPEGATVHVINTASRFTPRCAFVSHRKEVTKVWVVSPEGFRIHVWDAAVNVPAEEQPRDGVARLHVDDTQDLEAARAEVQYLKKKIKYIQSVGTIFRQRIGILFREKFRQRDHGAHADWGEFDTMYRQALTDLSGNPPDVPPGGTGCEVVAGGARDSRIEKLELDKEALQIALNEALRAHSQAAGHGGGPDVDKQIRFWKDKVREVEERLAAREDENRRLEAMLHDVGPEREIDIKRAHHICQVLKEKNQLKERERQLQEEMEKLKKALSSSEERFIELKNNVGDVLWSNNMQAGVAPGGNRRAQPDAARRGASADEGRDDLQMPVEQPPDVSASKAEKDHSRIQIETLTEDKKILEAELNQARDMLQRMRDDEEGTQQVRKQNSMLKARLAKMKQQLNSQRLDKTTEHTEMQSNIETLMGNISQMHNELGNKDRIIQEVSADKLRLMQDVSRMNTILERYKTKVLNLEREQISRSKAEQILDREHRKETQTLCASLDSREDKIQQLHSNFVDISEQLQHQVQQVSRTNHELDLMSRENMTLKSKLHQLDVLLEERRHFSALLSEVQGRMEMAIEELKRAQSTQELAGEVQSLEQRIAGLTALEAQLKQKDDLIAVRDDEVQRLKLKLALFERNVNNISAVFLQFPHSLEDMETLIIETDEYRKMAGRSAEFEERVRLRQLELRARRKQRQQQGVAKALHAGIVGSLDAATAALLARAGGDDSDEESTPAPPLPPQQQQAHGSAGRPASLGTPRGGLPQYDAGPSPPVLRMDG